MIEILIALLLSSILIGGVIQVFVSNKQTYYLQDELSRVQENGRFALEILQRSIRGAGFNNAAVGAFNTATTVDSLIDSTGVPNDSIHILSAGTIGCMGGPVVNDQFDIDSNTLRCSVVGAAPAPLIDNVINMQFLYGVDDDATRTADRYINATAVNAAGLWGSVVSVRVGLVLATSPREERSRMALQPMTFATVAANPLLSIFDTDDDGTPDIFGPGIITAPDNRLYRVFTSTITLRNRVP